MVKAYGAWVMGGRMTLRRIAGLVQHVPWVNAWYYVQHGAWEVRSLLLGFIYH